MKNFLYKNKINILFLLISFFCLLGIFGFENSSFQNTNWLHDGGESTYNQLSWYFFRNDVWRFPLGMNPNFGEELGNSIAFTDTVPLLSFFFKLFKSYLPQNFQYFTFWYFVCFFLQLLFSYKILKKFTESTPHSLIGSLFFIIAPIFIYRMDYHVGLTGQWILLSALYLSLNYKINKSLLLWISLVVISLLVFLYFTATILVIYSIFRLFHYYYEDRNFLRFTKDFFIILIVTALTFYTIGYFEIRMLDSIGIGFGEYKLNLLSFFDPVNSHQNISWSWFLKDIKLSAGEEIEGFNYFGLGQILMFIFVLASLLNKKIRKKLTNIKYQKEIKIFFIISIIFTLWALSNKISIGSYTLLEIPLNKYIFGALSLFKASGRLFWIVNYFLLILSIIIIFQCFEKKKSLLIITFFLIVQLADTSAGIKKRIYFARAQDESIKLKDKIWNNLFKKNEVVKTTFPKNWSRFTQIFASYMEKYNTKKTNIITAGRINRKAAASARYDLYKNFRKKNLSTNTIYFVQNLGHMNHLKYLFKNENVGFFFRDNIWSMVKNEKQLMNKNDKNELAGLKFNMLKINETKKMYYSEENNYTGFGWSHNFQNLGIWSEGNISTLFFRTEKDYGDIRLELICEPHITKKNTTLEFDVYINNFFIKKIKLNKNNLKDQLLEININKKFITSKDIKIDFDFKNPVSPSEVFKSPDSRKLGILLKKIKINQI